MKEAITFCKKRIYTTLISIVYFIASAQNTLSPVQATGEIYIPIHLRGIDLVGRNPKVINELDKQLSISKPKACAYFSWTIPTSSWKLTDTVLYTYDSNGRVVIVENRNGNVKSIESFTYDAQNRITNSRQNVWDTISNMFKPYHRSTTTYLSNNYSWFTIHELYDEQSNQWVENYGLKHDYHLDTQLRILDFKESVLYAPNQWKYNIQDTGFVYNGNNLTQFRERFWDTTGWINQELHDFAYGSGTQPEGYIRSVWNSTLNVFMPYTKSDSLSWKNWCGGFCLDSRLNSHRTFSWNANTNQWELALKITTNYDQFGGSTRLQMTYANSSWKNVYRYKYIRDSLFIRKAESVETWTNNAWSMTLQYGYFYTYDQNSDSAEIVTKVSGNFPLENYIRVLYWDYAIIADLISNKPWTNVDIFPNPATDFIEVQISEHKFDYCRFLLYNMEGKLISENTIMDRQSRMSRETIPNGIYIYKLVSSSGLKKIGKIVLD